MTITYNDTSVIITDNEITLFHNDALHTGHKSRLGDVTWDKVVAAYRDSNWDEICDLLAPRVAVERYATSNAQHIEVRDGEVLLNGQALHGALVDKIIDFATRSLPIQPLLNHLALWEQNPSFRSREQGFRFLENNHLPIREDGFFMAYKRVMNRDGVLVDCHSGTIQQVLGRELRMDRAKVDDDPQRTCSYGFHVCSIKYLKHFYGDTLLAVLVSPADVVAVPYDYNDSKMRVCAYTPYKVLPNELVEGGRDALAEAGPLYQDEVSPSDLEQGESFAEALDRFNIQL